MDMSFFTFDDVCNTLCGCRCSSTSAGAGCATYSCTPDLGCIERFTDKLEEQCRRCRATDDTPSKVHRSQVCIGQHADRCFGPDHTF